METQRFWRVIALFLAAATLTACEPSRGETPEQASIRRAAEQAASWAKVAEKIMYFQDHRTGICFAHYVTDRRTSMYGGIATVDCAKIPPQMLQTIAERK